MHYSKPCDVATSKNESYSVRAAQHNETTSTSHTYSSAGPNYDAVNQPIEGEYDVLNHNMTVESSPVVHSSTAVREKVTDQFHNAEQHLYAAVNKKEKKKISV